MNADPVPMHRAMAVAFLLFMPLSLTVEAAEPLGAASSEDRTQGIFQEQYGGVVTNQTITIAGQTFFQSFMAAWRDKEGSERYSLAVHERPSARLGSQIWIEYGQRRVFKAMVPPARAAIEPIGIQAADATYQAVVQAELQRKLFRDPDLAPDEL